MRRVSETCQSWNCFNSRLFHPNDIMSAVYDWVGSLVLTPEHFRLSVFDGICLSPSEPVTIAESTMLYMSECDSSPDMSLEDSQVNFRGFGQGNLDDTIIDTLSDFDDIQIQSSASFSSSVSSVHNILPYPSLEKNER